MSATNGTPSVGADLGEVAIPNFFGEAFHAVVRRMHFEHQAGVRTDGALVVLGPGAVCGAHLEDAGTSCGDDLGKPERSPDLDELAAETTASFPPANAAIANSSAPALLPTISAASAPVRAVTRALAYFPRPPGCQFRDPFRGGVPGGCLGGGSHRFGMERSSSEIGV